MLDWINLQVAQSLIRNILQWGAGAMVSSGWISGDESTQVQGIVLAIVALVFSMVSARTKNKSLAVSKAVEKSPNVVATTTITGETVIRTK